MRNISGVSLNSTMSGVCSRGDPLAKFSTGDLNDQISLSSLSVIVPVELDLESDLIWRSIEGLY